MTGAVPGALVAGLRVARTGGVRFVLRPGRVYRMREHADGWELVQYDYVPVVLTFHGCGRDEFGADPVETLIDMAFSRWMEN